MSARGETAGEPTLVDGHVHFHPCFDIRRFLGSAATNFAEAATWRAAADQSGVLMLTEARGERAFERIRDGLASHSVPGWSIRSTHEPTTMTATHDDGHLVTLVAGRQIVTRDEIEILAINTTSEVPDRAGLDETLEAVWEDDSIAIMPWGFGKWWWHRGRRVHDALVRYRGRPLMLGDNAGRLRRSAEPALFRLARSLEIAILPGSDPLPFPSEIDKVGRYGAVLRSSLDPQNPGDSVVRGLSTCTGRLEPFGIRESLPRFARLQVAMQWRKRFGRQRR